MDHSTNMSPVKNHERNSKQEAKKVDFLNYSLEGNKQPWIVKKSSSKSALTNYKTSNFFTGFHHRAYLENVQNAQTQPKTNTKNRSRSSSPYLPKIPYLMRKPVQNSIKKFLNPRVKLNNRQIKKGRNLQEAPHFLEQPANLTEVRQNSNFILAAQNEDVNETCLGGDQKSKSAFCLNFKPKPQVNDKNEVSKQLSLVCSDLPRKSKSEDLTGHFIAVHNFRDNKPNEITGRREVPDELINCCSKSSKVPTQFRKKRSLTLIPEQAGDEEVLCSDSHENNLNNSESKEIAPDYDLSNSKLNLKEFEQNHDSIQDLISSNGFSSASSETKIGLYVAPKTNNFRQVEACNSNDEAVQLKDLSFHVVTDLLDVEQQNAKSISNVCPKANNSNTSSTVIDILEEGSGESSISGASRRARSAPYLKFQKKHQYSSVIELTNCSSSSDRSKISRADQRSNSMIDSIKSKLFPELKSYETDKKDSSNWNDTADGQYDEDKLKFPKETKAAVMIMLSRSNRNHLVKNKQPQSENGRMVPQKLVETAASYSQAREKNMFRKCSSLPCTKNLLCEKGLHAGECAKSCIAKPPKCSEGCICRNVRIWCPESPTFWPGSAKRIEAKVNNSNCPYMSTADDAFLQNMEPKRSSTRSRHVDKLNPPMEKFGSIKNLTYNCPNCGKLQKGSTPFCERN